MAALSTYLPVLLALLLPAIIVLLADTAINKQAVDENGHRPVTHLLNMLLLGALLAIFFSYKTFIAGQNISSALTCLITFSALFHLLLLAASVKDIQPVYSLADCGSLVLISALGAVWALNSSNLLSMLAGILIIIVCTLALSGMVMKSMAVMQAAISSALYLLVAWLVGAFGLAIIYGVTGSLELAEIANVLMNTPLMMPLLLTGLICLSVLLLSIAGIMPFHIWLPDSCHGAPVIGVASYTVLGTATGLGLLLVVLNYINDIESWLGIIDILAVLSMIIAALMSLRQRSFRRLLAYLSIYGAGQILLLIGRAVEQPGTNLWQNVILAIAIYIITISGLMALCLALENGDIEQREVSIASIGGLFYRSPLVSIILALFLLSFIGMPLTAGFSLNILLFEQISAIGKQNLLLGIGVANLLVIIEIFRLIFIMFLSSFHGERRPIFSNYLKVLLWLTAGLVILLGIMPDILLKIC